MRHIKAFGLGHHSDHVAAFKSVYCFFRIKVGLFYVWKPVRAVAYFMVAYLLKCRAVLKGRISISVLAHEINGFHQVFAAFEVWSDIFDVAPCRIVYDPVADVM